MLTEAQLASIRAFGLSDPNVVAIHVFGSVADGRERVGSDVDLSVMLRRPVDGLRRMRMETELSNVVGRDVDLVVFHEASGLLKGQILRSRQLVYEGDRAERVRQETLGRYEYWDTRALHRELGAEDRG